MSPTVAAPIIACVAALLLTPMTSRLAHIMGWVDVPGLRKVHKSPVAYLGGAAVMGAFMIALGSMFLLPSASGFVEALDFKIGAIVLGALMMFATGLVDDVKNLKARTKLLAQIAAATLVVASGVSIDGITLTEDIRIEFGIFSVFITIFWIVGVTNAMNIIDGLDGLASGIAIIGSGAIAWTAFQGGHQAVGVLMLALLGAISGFLPYNVHPARAFLGDAGSLTVGFAIASSAALAADGSTALVGIAIPLIALGLPILDTLFSMSRRLIERRSILSPDRNHLHHRLIALGYGHSAIVAMLCGLTLVLTGTLILTTRFEPSWQGASTVAALVTYVAVFRATGAIRIRESAADVAKIMTDAKVAGESRRTMDHLGLQFREVTEFNQWWQMLGIAASNLCVAQMELCFSSRSGDTNTLTWTEGGLNRTNRDRGEPRTLFICKLEDRRVGSPPITLTVAIDSSMSLDEAGRDVSLLCQLLAAHAPAELPRVDTGSYNKAGRRAVYVGG